MAWTTLWLLERCRGVYLHFNICYRSYPWYILCSMSKKIIWDLAVIQTTYKLNQKSKIFFCKVVMTLVGYHRYQMKLSSSESPWFSTSLATIDQFNADGVKTRAVLITSKLPQLTLYFLEKITFVIFHRLLTWPLADITQFITLAKTAIRFISQQEHS